MSAEYIPLIFFFYGLAFFSMGLAITLEISQCSDQSLRNALRPLAGFGLLHGLHEWMEMIGLAKMLSEEVTGSLPWFGIRLGILVFSFLSLAAFGGMLIIRKGNVQRASLLIPLGLSAVWSFGTLILRNRYPYPELFDVADVWVRYSLAIPASLLASAGLVMQQRVFRQAALAHFGQDSLWAAVAFFWYGMIGQMFPHVSALPPSDVINQELFLRLFGFPVQLLRALSAIVASVFVIRFLRAFEVEIRRQIRELQEAKLEEARRREAMRGETLRRIVEAQEAERQRVARELHDETGQALTAIGMGLRAAENTLRVDVDKTALNLRQLEGLVANALNELRRLISDLRPSHLDDLGLVATLRWYLGEVQARSGIQVDFNVVGERHTLPIEVKTAIFRIVQEALTNIVRHAHAQHVKVSLTYNHDAVLAEVEDDGIGFDMLSLERNKRPPFGIIGMRERAALIGGRLEIFSQPGKGTFVQLIVPYNHYQNEKEEEGG